MSNINCDCALYAKAYLGEGPLWDVAEQKLYWVDIKRREVHRFDPATGNDEYWSTPEDVGSIAIREQGGLVLALASGFYTFDLTTGQATPIVKPEPELTENRFNDGKPDRQGRFWAASSHDPENKPMGFLYRLQADGRCDRMVDGLVVGNTLCWSPDNRTLYQGDSWQRTVWAWDFEPDSGDISNRRVFTTYAEGQGFPDGATVDADGTIWIAVWNGWRIDRFDPDGNLMNSIEMPVQCPTCPAFGGPNLDVMYVTSASNAITEPEKQPLAGAIFAITNIGVKGLAEARFKG